MREWDPDQALRDLAAESQLMQDVDFETTAKRLLQENLVPAVLAIAHLAVHSPNERIRLQAAQYIADRVLGRITDAGTLEADPFDSFLRKLTGSPAG